VNGTIAGESAGEDACSTIPVVVPRFYQVI